MGVRGHVQRLVVGQMGNRLREVGHLWVVRVAVPRVVAVRRVLRMGPIMVLQYVVLLLLGLVVEGVKWVGVMLGCRLWEGRMVLIKVHQVYIVSRTMPRRDLFWYCSTLEFGKKIILVLFMMHGRWSSFLLDRYDFNLFWLLGHPKFSPCVTAWTRWQSRP